MGSRFAAYKTTQWSIVLAAAESEDSSRRQSALANLYETYQAPVYAFVRRRGYDHEAACDLLQDFFARLLEKPVLANAAPENGRFRSFLIVSIKNFLANEWDRANAQKRGGGLEKLRLECDLVEKGQSPACGKQSPEQAFDQAWARVVLASALEEVEHDYARRGKSALFKALRFSLDSQSEARPYAEIAGNLGVTENGVKTAVRRMRQRYRTALLEQVRATVGHPDDAEAELRALLAAFRT